MATSSQASASAAIADRIASYIDCLVRRDAEAAEDYYTPDARLLGPGIDLDRSAAMETIRAAFGTYSEVEIDRRPLELFVHGDAAYEIAQADDTFRSSDGTSLVVRNSLFIRWERGDDGMWRFARVLMSPREPTPR